MAIEKCLGKIHSIRAPTLWSPPGPHSHVDIYPTPPYTKKKKIQIAEQGVVPWQPVAELGNAGAAIRSASGETGSAARGTSSPWRAQPVTLTGQR